jgi:hypothetical protein
VLKGTLTLSGASGVLAFASKDRVLSTSAELVGLTLTPQAKL